MKWGLRVGLLSAGIAAGVAALAAMDQAYLVHEQSIHTRPVFEPYGVKYAYATPPEPGLIRGWVAGMAPPAKPSGVKRIIALGDSVTFGLGVHASESVPMRPGFKTAPKSPGLIPGAWQLLRWTQIALYDTIFQESALLAGLGGSCTPYILGTPQ